MKTLAADRAVSAERALNTAIVNADITRGFEEYLALVDQYYAEDVEVSADTSPEPVVGRDRNGPGLRRRGWRRGGAPGLSGI